MIDFGNEYTACLSYRKNLYENKISFEPRRVKKGPSDLGNCFRNCPAKRRRRPTRIAEQMRNLIPHSLRDARQPPPPIAEPMKDHEASSVQTLIYPKALLSRAAAHRVISLILYIK